MLLHCRSLYHYNTNNLLLRLRIQLCFDTRPCTHRRRPTTLDIQRHKTNINNKFNVDNRRMFGLKHTGQSPKSC